MYDSEYSLDTLTVTDFHSHFLLKHFIRSINSADFINLIEECFL